MNTYYRILNEIAAVFDMDQWDEQVDPFTDAIKEQLNAFVHNTKLDKIYILENYGAHDFPQYNFYAEKCYVNGEKVELDKHGTAENKWFNKKTVDVTIEDLDQLGESCESMFYLCYSLISVPLFDTSNVTDTLSYMFNGCLSLKIVPKFDTRGVTDMSCMFGGCESLESVPLFDTRGVTDMTCMFSECKSLKTVPKFDTRGVTNIDYMFLGCPSLSEETIQDWSSVYDFEADKMR